MTPEQHRSTTISRPLTRRSAIARLATGALIGATTATFGNQAARAQEGSPVAGASKHAIYTLFGDGVELTCDFTRPDEPVLTLRGRLGDGTFEGHKIEMNRHLHLGETVSVTVDWVADAYTLDLTLLVPQINLKPGQDELSISTVAILTKHHQNIGGPNMVMGPLQSYHPIVLTGTFKATGD